MLDIYLPMKFLCCQIPYPVNSRRPSMSEGESGFLFLLVWNQAATRISGGAVFGRMKEWKAPLDMVMLSVRGSQRKRTCNFTYSDAGSEQHLWSRD